MRPPSLSSYGVARDGGTRRTDDEGQIGEGEEGAGIRLRGRDGGINLV